MINLNNIYWSWCENMTIINTPEELCKFLDIIIENYTGENYIMSSSRFHVGGFNLMVFRNDRIVIFKRYAYSSITLLYYKKRETNPEKFLSLLSKNLSEEEKEDFINKITEFALELV